MNYSSVLTNCYSSNHSPGAWHVGDAEHVGSDVASLFVRDAAESPEGITAEWQASNPDGGWAGAPYRLTSGSPLFNC